MTALRTWTTVGSAFGLLLVVTLAPVGSAFAQVPPTQEDIQTYRSNFTHALDLLDQTMAQINSAKGIELIAEARDRMAAITDEEIATAFANSELPDLSAWVAALEDQQSAMARAAPANFSRGVPGSSAENRFGGALSAMSESFPDAPPVISECDNIPHDQALRFGLLVATQAVSTAFHVAQFACLETILGFNTAGLCIALDIANTAATLLFDLAEWCFFQDFAAINEGSYERLAHIHDDLDSARADIISSSASSAASIISNDNSNTSSIIANDTSNTTSILSDINASTASIIASDTSNTTSILSDIDASTASIITNDNSNTSSILSDVDAKSAALAAQVAALQETVDTMVAKQSVSLQVIQLQEAREYLLTATEAGVPVGVTVIALDVSGDNPIAFISALGDATITPVKTGVLDIKLGSSAGSPSTIKLLEFIVQHSHGADPPHFGTAVVHRTAGNNLGVGQ